MTVPAPHPPLASLLTQKRPLVGVIMKMNSPANIELTGHLGFDLVIVDTEHGIGGGADLDHHLRAADAAAVPAIVRVSTLNRSEIQHALDGGAAGVVVPQVESIDAAAQAVRLSHYPPFGDRGLATSTRAGHRLRTDSRPTGDADETRRTGAAPRGGLPGAGLSGACLAALRHDHWWKFHVG